MNRNRLYMCISAWIPFILPLGLGGCSSQSTPPNNPVSSAIVQSALAKAGAMTGAMNAPSIVIEQAPDQGRTLASATGTTITIHPDLIRAALGPDASDSDLEVVLTAVLAHEIYHISEGVTGLPQGFGSVDPGTATEPSCEHIGLQLWGCMLACEMLSLPPAGPSEETANAAICKFTRRVCDSMFHRRVWKNKIAWCRSTGHSRTPGPPSWGIPSGTGTSKSCPDCP